MMNDDPEDQWELVCSLWDELDVERILAEQIPLHQRWQLDRLVEHMRRMDEIFAEQAYLQARFLAEMDGDDECIESLDSERANQ
jgi:hypothetical protein